MLLKIGSNKEIEVSNVFFTSDLHLNHTKIIEYCKRPFSSVEEMNEKIIENWNSIVGPDDYVFNLGDVVFGRDIAWEYVSKLNGHIILIKGNHDYHNMKEKYSQYFEGIYDFLCIMINHQKIYLSHFPLLCYDGCYDGSSWNLHGHTHLGPNSYGIDTERMKLRLNWQIDVGVDAWNYKPISFEAIQTIFNINSTKYRYLQEMNLDYENNPKSWNE